MTELIFYTIAAFGLAYILGHSSISLAPRTWLASKSAWLTELLECPACLGFWIGLFWALPYWGLADWRHFLAYPVYTAGANFLLGRLTRLIESEPT